MADTAEGSYPTALRRRDEARGRRDGEQRTPALAEVRRRHQEVLVNGGQLAVGYQLVLLAELNGRLNELYPLFQRTGRHARHEIRQCRDAIEQAVQALGRAEDNLRAAAAALTEEELRPRNPEEERWSAETLRNRREVARSRRIARARAEVDGARQHLAQRKADLASAERRRDEAMADFGVRARRLQDLYQRRMTAYIDALARSHPDGRTLYPLLNIPEIPLPRWVPHPPAPDGAQTTAGVLDEEEEAATFGTATGGEAADGTEQPARPADEH
ncbi:hypothetical protein [Luedemannella helvata]|uniref:Uncharacterized protein n=1 Tax=Luedemannella helvata TaxID=349315 RepID=A0ABN2L7B3_9ACTN